MLAARRNKLPQHRRKRFLAPRSRHRRRVVGVPLHESAEIEPLEMGLSEPHDGMVQIETIDETGDPLDFHGGV